MNPMKKLPTLQINDMFLTQTVAIMEFLETRYPEKSLTPEDILEKQRMKDQSKYMEEKFGKERKKDLTPKQLKEVNEKFLPKPSTSFDCYDEENDETEMINKPLKNDEQIMNNKTWKNENDESNDVQITKKYEHDEEIMKMVKQI